MTNSIIASLSLRMFSDLKVWGNVKRINTCSGLNSFWTKLTNYDLWSSLMMVIHHQVFKDHIPSKSGPPPAGRLRCMQVSFILSGAEIKTIVPVDCKSIHSFEYLHCRFYNNVVSGTASDQVKLYGIIANLSTASITYAISGVQSAHRKYFTSKPSPDEGLRRCCAFWQRRLRCQMFTMGYPMSLSVATIFSSSL